MLERILQLCLQLLLQETTFELGSLAQTKANGYLWEFTLKTNLMEFKTI